MNDIMNEFDRVDRDASPQPEGESWRAALGGLLKEVALASTDSLTRRLRRAELEMEQAADELPTEAHTVVQDAVLSDATSDVRVEVVADSADAPTLTTEQFVARSEPMSEPEGKDETEIVQASPAPRRRSTRNGHANRSGKPPAEENFAKRVLNWSAGTVISNIADNEEIDALVERQLKKRLPELARDPQVQELIRAQAGMYLAYLLETPQKVEPLVRVLGDRYISYLRAHPEQVQSLIREQAGEYLNHLGQDTAQLEPLVQSVAGKYIDHLGAHPEQVQRLIQQEAGTYLVHLKENPAQVEPLVQTIAGKYIAYLTEHPEPVQKLIQQEADKFIVDLQAQPERVEPLVHVLAGRYLKHLETHPEDVEKLVQLLADRYLGFLRENPAEVNMLVRQVGDEYIGYLHEHPDQVQDLIQSQSLNMGNEVMEEVRQRTVTADSFIELLARSLLRRTPREQLSEPSVAVQMRAVNPRQQLPIAPIETAIAQGKEKQ